MPRSETLAPPARLEPQAPLLETWTRRAVSIPVYFGLAALVFGTFPLLFALLLLVDLLRPRRFVLTRCLLYFSVYLAIEVYAVIAAPLLWLFLGGPIALRGAWWRRAHYKVQRGYQWLLFWPGARFFGFDVAIEGAEEAELHRGPFIVLSRHASVVDTVLPANLIANPHRIRLRYVLKRELLWDPALDIYGGRLPNYFIDRKTTDPDQEAEEIGRLCDDLGPKDGVLIFPEGTRFTPRKRERALARLAEAGDALLLERARQMHHVLPPRLRGTLALLEHNAARKKAGKTPADVLLWAHTGLERARSFREFFAGALVGVPIRVRVWRLRHEDIPDDEQARVRWLLDQWARVDAWLATQAS